MSARRTGPEFRAQIPPSEGSGQVLRAPRIRGTMAAWRDNSRPVSGFRLPAAISARLPRGRLGVAYLIAHAPRDAEIARDGAARGRWQAPGLGQLSTSGGPSSPIPARPRTGDGPNPLPAGRCG